MTDSKLGSLGPSARIAAAYVLVSVGWILVSDRVPLWFTSDPGTLAWFQSVKGVGFVLVTGLLLFGLIRRSLRARESLAISLAETVRRQEAMIANLPGIVYRSRNDDARTAEFVDGSCQEILGVDADHFTEDRGASLAEWVHPEDRERVREEIARAIERSEPFVLTYRVQRSDGSVRWVWEQGRASRDGSGAAVALEGFLTDVTDRKQLEEHFVESRKLEATSRLDRLRLESDLEQSERTSRLLLSSVRDIVYAVRFGPDPMAGAIEFVSDEAERSLGYAPEAFREDPSLWARLIHPDDARRVAEETARLTRGEATRREYRVRHGLTGEYRWLEDRVVPQTDAEGNTIGLFGVARDVTEQKRIEDELRASRDRLRMVVSAAPLVLYAIDDREVFTFSDGKGLEALGLAPGEVVGRSVREVYPDVPRVQEDVRRALAGEEASSTVDVHGRRFQALYAPVRDASGRVTGLVGIAVDTTDRHRAEESLARTEAQLVQAQKMEAVGRLAGGVAHDFNNLLSAILGYADLLYRDAAPGDPAREDLEEILKAGRRAAGLTRQLLAFSRRQVLSPEILDLNELLAQIYRMLHRLIGEDIELVLVPGAGIGTIEADPGQIEQVVLNLAVNARDAMPEGGRLTLRTSTESDPVERVVLSVEDTGTGMDAATLARIFEPFYTTKPEGRGTGLGLASVHGIVEQSGGTIEAVSAPGQGSTFTIRFPRAQDPPTVRAAGPGPIDRGSGRILLVEDDESVRRLARRILEGAGYEILEATSGREALRIQEDHLGEIDLLVSDVVMPGMSGRVLAERLRERRPDLRVLLMSGYTDDALVRHGVDQKTYHLYQKPIEPETFARRVRELLGH